VTDAPRAAVVLTGAVLAVCACGAGPQEPEAGRPRPTAPAMPGQTFEVLPPPPPVVWADDGAHLAVTTSGSSSCPLGPTDAEVVGAQEVRVHVTFLFPDRDPCTADIAPTTTEIDVPEGISADEPLTVVLDLGSGVQQQVVLPPAGR
jgi:hypothetical protein